MLKRLRSLQAPQLPLRVCRSANRIPQDCGRPRPAAVELLLPEAPHVEARDRERRARVDPRVHGIQWAIQPLGKRCRLCWHGYEALQSSQYLHDTGKRGANRRVNRSQLVSVIVLFPQLLLAPDVDNIREPF